MIENDTVRLLRECDAGVDMGVSAISDVMGKVGSSALKMTLNRCKTEHEKLKTEIEVLLNSYHDEGKEPNPVAKGMSWIKTNVKMAADDSFLHSKYRSGRPGVCYPPRGVYATVQRTRLCH